MDAAVAREEPSGKPATQAPRSTGGGGALATEAQINLIRGKVERAGIDPNDFLARFELGELAELQFDDVNDALAWIKDNAR
jgi:hypothetical protein